MMRMIIDVQLWNQLELIEAAHIVPHSHNLGTMMRVMALCVLHHKAF